MGDLTKGFLAGSNLANPYLGGETEAEAARQRAAVETSNYEEAVNEAKAGNPLIYEVDGLGGLVEVMLDSSNKVVLREMARKLSNKYLTVEQINIRPFGNEVLIEVFAQHGSTTPHFGNASMSVKLPAMGRQKELLAFLQHGPSVAAESCGVNRYPKVYQVGSWKNNSQQEVTVFNEQQIVLVEQYVAAHEELVGGFLTAAEVIAKSIANKWHDHYFAEEKRLNVAFLRTKEAMSKQTSAKPVKNTAKAQKREAENIVAWQPEATPINNPFAVLAGLKKG